MDTRTKVDMVEVEDIIDRLQDECACEHGHCCSPCKDRMALNGLIRANEMMAQDLASKEAQLREAEREARRLDFVDANFYRMPIAKDPLGWHLIVGYPSFGSYKLIGTFREAIDAALASES